MRSATGLGARFRYEKSRSNGGTSQASRDRFETVNAQTPRKTSHHPGPEDKASQQHPHPDEICKTSMPGSNPGGASKIQCEFIDSSTADDGSLVCNCSRVFSDPNARHARTRAKSKTQRSIRVRLENVAGNLKTSAGDEQLRSHQTLRERDQGFRAGYRELSAVSNCDAALRRGGGETEVVGRPLAATQD